MRDRLASLIVVKQEGGSNTSISHHQATAIKCEASLYTESSLFQEINNNSCYRQNLNAPTHQQSHTSHLQHAQQHQTHQQHPLLPPPLPTLPLIYPCRNLFPDGCDINHLACCSSSNSNSNCNSDSNSTSSSPGNSHFFANGNTCMYLVFPFGLSVLVTFSFFVFLYFPNSNAAVVFSSNSLIAHAAHTQCAARIAKSAKKLTVCSIRLRRQVGKKSEKCNLNKKGGVAGGGRLDNAQ